MLYALPNRDLCHDHKRLKGIFSCHLQNKYFGLIPSSWKLIYCHLNMVDISHINYCLHKESWKSLSWSYWTAKPKRVSKLDRKAITPAIWIGWDNHWTHLKCSWPRKEKSIWSISFGNVGANLVWWVPWDRHLSKNKIGQFQYSLNILNTLLW